MPKRYFVALLVIAIVFFGLIGLAINSLTKDDKGDNKKQNTSQKQNQQPAKDFVKDTKSVVYTQQGKLVGDEQRRAIRITVTPSERKVDILQGYDQTVIKSQTFANKQNAYDTFIIALNAAGFDEYNTEVGSDERAACPTGRRYIYEAVYNDSSKYRSWAASCQKSGSFKGNNGLVRTLFEDQIPELNKFLSGTRLN